MLIDKDVDRLADLQKRVDELEATESRYRQKEKAIRESERRYRALIGSMTDIIFTMDRDWNFTFLSPEFEGITGYSVQDLIWHPLTEVIAPEYAKELLDDLSSGVFDEIGMCQETVLIHSDSSRIPIELTALPIADVNGQLTGVILCAVRDLTKRKRREEEFLRSQKLESIGLLAGGIAHDFNNMLTTILGNISLVKMYIESDEAVSKVFEKLAESEEACIQARNLTQQLLTFSTHIEPIKKVICIAELLRDSARLALSGSNVSCEFSIPDDLVLVEADEGQMNQIANNLVVNAKQAMPEGGTVRISVENVTIDPESIFPLNPGAYIKISVEDNGVGIPEQNLQRIFDPYFTTKHKSSGLGLATSYSIVKKHDGHITVESLVGVGTTLHIYLPAYTEEFPAKVEITKEEAKPKPSLSKKRILVMDDEDSIRLVICEILNRIGHEVVVASNGIDAVELYKEAKEMGRPYDVVILDLTIPLSPGGKEAIQKLKAIDPEVKAIASSGYSKHAVMVNFEEYGFKGAIAKPYKVEDLIDVLYKVITGNRHLRES